MCEMQSFASRWALLCFALDRSSPLVGCAVFVAKAGLPTPLACVSLRQALTFIVFWRSNFGKALNV